MTTVTSTRRPCDGDPDTLGVVHDWQPAEYGLFVFGTVPALWRCATCGLEDED